MGRPNRKDTSGVVYLIIFPNGRKYVGITATSFDERKRSHFSHRNSSRLPVHQALKNFAGQESWEVIGTALDWEQLLKLEVEMIEAHKSHISENGYNLTRGGDGTVGYEHNDDQKRRNSESKKRFFSNPDNRRRQSIITQRAHKDNPEQAKQHSEFQKKRFENKSERKRVADQMKSYLSIPENVRVHAVQRGAKPFFVYKLDGSFVGEWLTQHQCARDLSLQVSRICDCLKGKRKTHGGYRFSDKETTLGR